MEQHLTKNGGFFNVLRPSKVTVLNIQAEFAKLCPTSKKLFMDITKNLKELMKMIQFSENRRRCVQNTPMNKKHAKWHFCSQEEANIGRQDDPPKVGFPIGFERFLLLNLNSIFGRFGNGLIFVKMPKMTQKMGPDPGEGCRNPLKNNALRKKGSEGYMAKENRPKGALLRKSCLESSLSPKGYIAKATKHCKTR